ncbi:type 1 fimbrial protein [Burkholderia sp. FERM BP-3421]|jgi:major type 1 subunit fimbrin (pilin)|uniref:fimbrial protein n=1 Tax=Burkholderia sp. FERM BP-3421 TaxID=1494466 RepID=UPI00235EC8DF|nr:fimbrial protein [Burkholderia sp. FERM BP-3421]WDD94029.1 type 1 fimbrial protein [Burkholderia sp. FERM BP-3421]
MKLATSTKLISTLLAAAGLSLASAAHASDGTITFTGNVTAGTCKIDGKDAGATTNKSVVLPTVSTGALNTSGAVSGRTGFGFKLTGCAVDSEDSKGNPTKVQVTFENATNVTTDGKLALDKGSVDTPEAKNVVLQILNDKQDPIKVGANSPDQNSQVVSIDSDGTAELNFFAEYLATGAVTGGSANSYVQYSLVYP